MNEQHFRFSNVLLSSFFLLQRTRPWSPPVRRWTPFSPLSPPWWRTRRMGPPLRSSGTLPTHSEKLRYSTYSSGLWIRIRKDPHSFSLLDLDSHSTYGSGATRKFLKIKIVKMLEIFSVICTSSTFLILFLSNVFLTAENSWKGTVRKF